MGGGRASLHSSRSEFLAADALNGDLEYRRNGGCFVTTKKAIACLILAIAASIIVGVLMYYYGPTRENEEGDLSSDIETLLNNSLKAISEDDSKLPRSIYPLHYRLRIHPILDENTTNKFTFNGRVTILLNVVEKTKKIELHSEGLDISTVTLVTTKQMLLKSDSQVRQFPYNSNAPPHNAPVLGAPNNFTRPNPSLFPPNPRNTTNVANITNADGVGISTNTSASNVSTNSIAPQNKSDLNPVIPLSTEPTTTKDTKANLGEISSTSIPALDNTTNTISNNNNTVNNNNRSHITISIPDDITTTMYQSSKITNVNIKNTEEKTDATKLIVNLLDHLEPGQNYTIDIQFSGKITDNLAGLYKTSFMSDGAKKWLATTFMLPSNARKVFPCFDEPEFKSQFSISIARRTNVVVLSNMPIKSSDPMPDNPGWVWEHFKTSPPMSTYLVAFTIGELEKLRSNTTNMGPVFNMWAPKSVLSKAKYALETGSKIFNYLENYYGIDYSLHKIDFVVVPEMMDEVQGSWGLISLRESSVLVSLDEDDWESKSSTFNVIAQGLSHQWFGNLVTIKNWKDFWLNKALNTFMANLAVINLQPLWNYYNSFLLRITQPALYSDSLKSTHSLYLNSTNLQEEQLFDDIYKKGTSLFRMLNYTLKESVFRDGVKKYLQKWAYNSSDVIDLWDTYNQITENNSGLNISVKEFMNSWIFQNGYPVVTVTRDYSTGFVNISQEIFTENRQQSPNLWYIPLSYQIGAANKSEGKLVLAHKQSILTDAFKDITNDSWILFNVDQTGFYRVNYDLGNWKLLQDQLEKEPPKLSASNRAQILNDAFELAEMGYVSYNVSLNLTKYLSTKETSYVPFIAALQSLQELKPIFESSQYYGLYQNYIWNLVKSSYEKLGNSAKKGEPLNDYLLRNYIIQTACDVDYEPCVAWAKQIYNQWMTSSNTNLGSANVRKTIMCTSIKTGGYKEWEFLWKTTLSPNISESDLEASFLSLGCTNRPWLLRKLLEKSLNGEVPLQNIPHVWKSISHPEGLYVGLSFLREKWSIMEKRYGDVSSIFKSIIEEFVSKLSTDTDLENLTQFYKNNNKNLKQLSPLIKTAVDRIKLRIDWRGKHLQNVASWFQNNIQ